MANGDDDPIIICNGVGPILRTDNVPIPYYENGICIIAWKPHQGMDQKHIDKVNRKLQRLHDEVLDAIEDATGGTIYPKP